MDVELDQIMTFFRVGLVNLYTYLTQELLGPSSVAMSRFVQSVLLLPARIRETADRKEVLLQYNAKEPEMMDRIHLGLKRINLHSALRRCFCGSFLPLNRPMIANTWTTRRANHSPPLAPFESLVSLEPWRIAATRLTEFWCGAVDPMALKWTKRPPWRSAILGVACA